MERDRRNLRGTPLWSFYIRCNGGRVGRRVFINSLAVSDHNLLEFEDDVIVGDGVHLSGHTVEDGFVRTAGVRLGRGTMLGLGSVIGIGVETGPFCRVGALSVVPKFAKLDAETTYVGAPVHKLDTREPFGSEGVHPHQELARLDEP